MPTEAQLVDAGQHDCGGRCASTTGRGSRATPAWRTPAADPETKTSLKMRLGYDEAREFMRNAVRPRLVPRA